MDTNREKVSKVVCLGEVDDYLYDISIKDQDPFFFANDVLVHNTDSVMFSAWPFVKDAVERGEMEWNAEIAIKLYDSIADQVNESFPPFMKQAFNCPTELGSLIRGGREIVASKGLFIKKKRYAMNVIDKENKRQDVNGKLGKLKAMGLDLKRSDTPKIVQEFLSKILIDTLTGEGEADILPKITEFKKEFSRLPPWEKGTPKRVNKLTYYGNLVAASKRGGKTKNNPTIPGHVRAALNWNTLKAIHHDNYSGDIVDGQKVIVCKLKQNPLGMTSIAYPIDQTRLPDWFKELPFDSNEMESSIVDQKVENLLGVLEWDLASTAGVQNAFALMFGKVKE